MLTNQELNNIKQFKQNIKSVDILKQIFDKSTFTLPINEYMKTNHTQLNHYFETNNFNCQSQKSLRGKINEFFILLYFRYYGITNLYPQAYLFFIPDIKFDLVLFTHTKRIIAFNFKTCLRDRYKQAIIEGQQLKKLDTRFEYYLLTNHTSETQRLNEKLKQGKVQSINKVINLFSPNSHSFFQNFSRRQFITFPNINLIKK
ncbi:Conserved hypothetical protein [Candidatus Phytoplasma australiense]|uniref:Uncharacterized protein n=1 Tax=Phytoplasma australiense TaxID=59748 RepID=B1V9L6_PHYAS|nr:Conserved hypothetical protein [Candidatus Phytoplasma australiense]CAM11697.1 Conserved hypothetical protein [Candidatus Phytoplasma australiense]